MKNLFWIAAALVLLVLFPGLLQAIAAAVAAAAVWLSTQPVLIGFGLGLVALPHLRRPAKTVGQ
ncbi:hypothetical protein K388_05548 [Streptomyces sp. KhCrAH-43]|uniref:hypothetical protein n=1 Tax=unclassified Streptomyces TaxID=2593676 RepID=UPI00037378DD|nr:MULTISPECIES: hypothetical protein [unclassified Streptomyces]MYX67392.1 hypothetical protein [Streptomyces sp. SID8373]RAJ53761.1 hypothetical protein K388_05548 [Streptomyces sp. KhCrAH-43]